MPRFFDADSERWMENLTLGEPISARCNDGYLVTVEHAEMRLILADGNGNDVVAVELDLFVSPKALAKLAAAGGIVPFPPSFAEQMGPLARGIVTMHGNGALLEVVSGAYDGDVVNA
ncbi:MAG: hypothetical protein KJO07_09745, partial [Deltaproteobacteria bacterium]|nr:hypothetical protein [Deltaproteobacteria bacterium]